MSEGYIGGKIGGGGGMCVCVYLYAAQSCLPVYMCMGNMCVNKCACVNRGVRLCVNVCVYASLYVKPMVGLPCSTLNYYYVRL